MTYHDLPAVNATLNSLSAVLLTLGFIFIKRGNKIAHRNCMIAAFSTSVIFLACYLTYHALVKTVTHFVEPPWFRPIYLTILLTHTFLAVVIAPLILVTLAYRSQKILDGRKTISFWLIVAALILLVMALITGFIFGSPRTPKPHFNLADVIAGGLLIFSFLLGFISLLLFKFKAHATIARWTWPLWMYVSVTGVVVYLLLYQIFPQR